MIKCLTTKWQARQYKQLLKGECYNLQLCCKSFLQFIPGMDLNFNANGSIFVKLGTKCKFVFVICHLQSICRYCLDMTMGGVPIGKLSLSRSNTVFKQVSLDLQKQVSFITHGYSQGQPHSSLREWPDICRQCMFLRWFVSTYSTSSQHVGDQSVHPDFRSAFTTLYWVPVDFGILDWKAERYDRHDSSPAPQNNIHPTP